MTKQQDWKLVMPPQAQMGSVTIQTPKQPPMTKAEFLSYHERATARMSEITRAKNNDYSGGTAETDPFKNFRQIGSLGDPSWVNIGFLTRMSDKLARLATFVRDGKLKVKDEAVEDTLLDLANYCILFAAYIKSESNND